MTDPEPPFKKAKQEEPEEEFGVKLNDLPELPFEKILGYLSLEDLIKARAVSRKWYKVISSFRTKSLCVSERPIGFLKGKARLVSGAFTRNFVNSSRFERFFQTFGHSILCNLKNLRLCKINLHEKNTTALTLALNSFDQLEELGLFKIYLRTFRDPKIDLELNLPMLNSIHLESVDGIKKLTLDAPKLKDVKLVGCDAGFRVNIVHGESVEMLITDDCHNMEVIEVKKLKKLKFLYCGRYTTIDPMLLSNLGQLKEIHVYQPGNDTDRVSDLFQQKKRYGRTDLKIFFCGCFLDGPAIDSIPGFGQSGYVRYLAENRSRLAKILISDGLSYDVIEGVDQELALNVLKRFTDLEMIAVLKPVQDIGRFLSLLKNLNNIVALDFNGDDSQELFDRLPEHCAALESLYIGSSLEDFDFLLKLKSLIYLNLRTPIDIEFIQKVLQELPFLSVFVFYHLNRRQLVEVRISPSRQFEVSVPGKKMTFSDRNDIIQFIAIGY